jgi:hypothetical protein
MRIDPSAPRSTGIHGAYFDAGGLVLNLAAGELQGRVP